MNDNRLKKVKTFSYDILFSTIIFTLLGFVIAVMFFSFNILAYILLTSGGLLLGIIIGVWTGKKDSQSGEHMSEGGKK